MKIDIVDWKLIGTCNLRCLHCYGPLKKEKPLPLEQLLTLISKFEELKLSWVVITGGEPLIVPNIDTVMRTLKQVGVKIALSTNSTFFRRFQKLIEECVSSLNIPLDGSTPQTHAASRMDEKSFHTFFDVLEHYHHCPERKPEILRVGSVYSKATHGDFVAMAQLLEPYARLIDTWKIYEIIDYEFQPELRQPIMHEHDTFGEEMAKLLEQTDLAPKITLAPAKSRDKAYFMVNPRGDVVVPTDKGGMTYEIPIGNLLTMPLAEVVANWQQYIAPDNYYLNHRLHYDKTKHLPSGTVKDMMEHLDILDDEGNIIGQATQEEVYEKKHSHRIVHVLVINPKAREVYLQQRAETKSFLPGHYCTSAGGHVHAGETYEQAAQRELYEEIGLTTPVQEVHRFVFESAGHKRFITLFVASATGGFDFKDGEVSGGKFYPLDAALALVEKGEKIHPQLDPCLRWLEKHQDEIFVRAEN